MMNTREFILYLKNRGISVSVMNDDLKLRTEVEPTAEDLSAVKERKAELIKFLSGKKITPDTGTIPNIPLQESYPLSHAQQRFWILSELSDNAAAYNMQGVMLFNGALDQDLLTKAVRALVERHESLRTVFRENEAGEVRQYILPADTLNLTPEFIEISEEAVLHTLYAEAQSKHFDLRQGPLLHTRIVKIAANRYAFYYTLHHIISDGWSMEVLAKELAAAYNVFKQGKEPSYAPLSIQYKDYAAWQTSLLEGNAFMQQEQYWLKQFEGELPVLDLPSDKIRPAVKTYSGSEITYSVPASTITALKSLCIKEGGTLFMGLLAGLKALFYRYTGQEDIIVGSPIAGREHSVLENQIGLYLNSLALRTRFTGTDTFRALLKKEKEVLLSAYSHQIYPYDMLIQKLNLSKDISRLPLFDIMVGIENQVASQEETFDGVEITGLDGLLTQTSQFDLSFNFIASAEQLSLTIVYNTDIFSERNIADLYAHYENLLREVVSTPEIALKEINYLSLSERAQLLEVFSGSNLISTADKNIVTLFESQVLLTPDLTAIIHGDTRMSYRELNAAANQLANYLLQEHNAGVGDLIGLQTSRSPEMVIGLLGILKTGATYVPIDIFYPEERISFMIADAGIRILLRDNITGHEDHAADNPAINITLSDIAYVIYTSGSTGQPKGVLVTHGNAAHFFDYVSHQYGSGPGTVFPFIASNSFDISLFQLFTPLLTGGTSVIIDREVLDDIALFTAALKEVTMIDTVPGVYNLLVNYIHEHNIDFSHIQRLFIGGDVIPDDLLVRLSGVFTAASINITYGPTEGTIFCTDHTSTSTKGADLGHPINGSSIYILDKDAALLPIGVTGEICIGGAGVSNGYHNQATLTAEKFIANPYKAGDRLYRTGDLGRWEPDGHLTFIGRADAQVKIRGFRIEPGEIERALLGHEQIREAIVLAKDDLQGGKYLVGYIVSEEELAASSVRSFLSATLPDYMIPSYFIRLEQLPLTSNGKIDRKALPEPGISDTYTPAGNETEERLVKIWEEVLSKTGIGIHDNFFETGGHSLKAIQLVSRIRKEFEITIALKDIFSYPDIAVQAEYIRLAAVATFTDIPKTTIQESYPLSHAQNRFWILSQVNDSSVAYNIPGVLLLEGTPDLTLLGKVLQYIVTRHESLRTVFRQNAEGEVRQYILPADAFNLVPDYLDVSAESDPYIRLQSIYATEQLISFDLEQGPLLRTKLVKAAADQYALFYTMHHIISDGWSMEVLSKEVIGAYNAFKQGKEPEYTPLSIQYKDYAAWQTAQLEGDGLKQLEQYWLKQLEGELPVLNLPSDKIRPAVKTHRGSEVTYSVPVSAIMALKSLCIKEGGTLFMGLLAGLKALFYRYTGQEDIILGSPIAGREHGVLENQIGLYLNSLALRTRFTGTDTFRDLLKKEKEVLLGAYSHQLYPYDMLIQKLNLSKDTSRLPLFDIMVSIENKVTGQEETFDGVKITGLEGLLTQTSQFDISFNFIASDDQLKLSVVYNTDIFSEKNIADLYAHYENLLQEVVTTPEITLKEINYLSLSERAQLLEVFSGSNVTQSIDKNIVALFESQVLLNPDLTAIIHGDTRMSYRELNAAANQLANYLLQEHNAGVGDLVGLQTSRSPEMVIGLLGILKTGATYVPIDISYPEERISFMIADAGIRILLRDNITGHEDHAADNPAINITLSDIAYVIYTSGSTGQPKGVLVTHSNAAHFFDYVSHQYGSGPGTVFPFIASNSFDISLFQLLTPLLTGGTSVIIDREVLDDIALFTAQLKEVTMIDTVPGVYNLLVNYIQEHNFDFSHIQRLFIGGDVIPDDLLTRLSGVFTAASIHITYGPTEGTIFCTDQIYAATKGSDLGRPINGSSIYILDKDAALLPVGVTGEICIGGAGVSNGYHNQATLTAEKFIANPYKVGDRLYRTGDLGRWEPDGHLTFIGRADAQVKIRGFRIEPGEIERALLGHEQIREAIVLAKDDLQGGKYLVGYIVSEEELAASGVRSFLSATLPDYMIPSYFIRLEQLPLTSNGKIDRKALPEPGISDTYTPAGNEMEERLVKIWEEVLGRTGIGIHDNFFEVGGDSIKSIQIGSRIRKYGYTLSVADILQYPTPAELALKAVPIIHDADQGEITGEVILSPVQHSFLERTDVDKHHFNQSVSLYSRTAISEEGIREIFKMLCSHHDALRLRYIREGDNWHQEYAATGDGFSLDVYDWKTSVTKEEGWDLMTTASQQLQSGISLSEGPLIKLGLFRLPDGDRLLIIIHHLVVDGVSWRILLEDITTLHKQFLNEEPLLLPGKSDSFKYWMERQTEYARTNTLLKEIDFWKKQEMRPVEKLPITHPEEGNRIADARTIIFSLPEETTYQLLTTVNRAYNTEIDDVLLTALGMSLREVFGMQQVMIGMEGHGRQKITDNVDVSRTVGWFASVYPVMLDMGFSEDLSRQLIEVKETLRSIPNKGIGYGILKYLSEKEQVADLRFNLQPEITFNYLGQLDDAVLGEKEETLFSFSSDYKGDEVSKELQRSAALEVNGILFGGILSLQIIYSEKQYHSSVMEQLISNYERQLTALISHCVRIKDTQVTPSDLGDTEMSIETFNNLFN